jgi:peptidyl-prolyl cis-trans isomerase SurA
MSVNEISTPILMQDEKGEDAYRIIQLKSRSQPHRANLEEDYDYIQNLAMQMKQQETIIEWIKNNAKKSYININEKYNHCAFEQSWF